MGEEGSANAGMYAIGSDEESACSGGRVREVGCDFRASIICREGGESFRPLSWNQRLSVAMINGAHMNVETI